MEKELIIVNMLGQMNTQLKMSHSVTWSSLRVIYMTRQSKSWRRRESHKVLTSKLFSWKWCCHDSNKMGLLLKSQKKCDVGRQVWFSHIEVTWWSCVVLPQHVTTDFAYFIFYFCDSFKFTNSNNKKYQPQPMTTTPPSQSCEEEPKKSATTAAMADCVRCHCSGNFSCNSLFWLLRLTVQKLKN